MTEEQGNNPIERKRNRSRIAIFAGMGVAFLLGMAATAVLGARIMPGAMIITRESKLGMEDTVSELKAAAEEQGWVVAGVRNMNKSLSKHDRELEPSVRLVELCHPDYAQSILKSDRHLSTMMPCAIAVWQRDDGQVMVSNMNTGMMGKLFGGNAARVLSGRVAPDEERMLTTVLKEKETQ
jgi:uncharacterized protein (DUF302 family)